MIACPEATKERRRHRGHSRCGRTPNRGSFQKRHTLLENGSRRIAISCVGITRSTLEPLFCLFRPVIGIAGSQVESFAGLLKLASALSSPDRERLRSPPARVFV